jgi:hypothetical protein
MALAPRAQPPSADDAIALQERLLAAARAQGGGNPRRGGGY